ncbi:kynureninase [Saccharopolyspora rosea]|uniref:kynureninase n=1 Tax=Saccharopolyspora rosea TaxID=524884 RepID=UPI0021D84433|nr:kynureninase [Saccharopolyspora rosea]
MDRSDVVAELEKLARDRDSRDELAELRNRFTIPDGVSYLDGNSLGPPCRTTSAALTELVDRQWAPALIEAWERHDWWSAPRRVGDRIGRVLGAAEGQVVVGESTSVQIFNALTTGCRLAAGREVVLVDADHFPTDLYLSRSVTRLLGLRPLRVPMGDAVGALDEHGDEVAVVFCSAVDFRTGELADIPGVTEAAHRRGALVLWDLSHAAGLVPLELDTWQVDLAVGCTYKFLNGGPGAPAFLYVSHRHQDSADPVLTGWHGHRAPFGMDPEYQPAEGIDRFRIGTPQVLSMLALEHALAVFDEVTTVRLWEKCGELADFFRHCFAQLCGDLDLTIVTPADPARRGGHITVHAPEAARRWKALAERGVLGDLRNPDMLRFGLSPLVVRFSDVARAVTELADISRTDAHLDDRFAGTGLMG